MTKPRRRVKRPRQSVKPREATKPLEKGAESPSTTSSKRIKPGLSPEAWEKIGKFAPAVLDAVAKLIDSISRLK